MLEREQLAGSAHSRLYLINDQQKSMLLAELDNMLYEFRLYRIYAALGLNHLQHNRRSMLSDRTLQRSDIMKWNTLEACWQRCKALFHLILPCSGQGSQCTTMEGLREGNHLITAGSLHLLMITASKLDGSLIRLRSTVTEEDGVCTAVGRQQRCGLLLSWNVEQIGYMP
ncbi:hypothetical protein D1872_255990 [compost metagenome]